MTAPAHIGWLNLHCVAWAIQAENCVCFGFRGIMGVPTCQVRSVSCHGWPCGVGFCFVLSERLCFVLLFRQEGFTFCVVVS